MIGGGPLPAALATRESPASPVCPAWLLTGCSLRARRLDGLFQAAAGSAGSTPRSNAALRGDRRQEGEEGEEAGRDRELELDFGDEGEDGYQHVEMGGGDGEGRVAGGGGRLGY